MILLRVAILAGAYLLGAVPFGLLVARRFEWWDTPLWLVFSVLGLGAMLTITGVAARTRYHALRMRE